MKIKATVPYYGSKRTLAPRIIRQFGEHVTYVETFAGSLAVLLAKPPSRHEVVSELNIDMVNLFRVLSDRDNAERLHSFVSLVPYCETLYLESCDRLRSGEVIDPVERARDYMIVSWMGLNGLAGTTRRVTFARRSTATGGNGPTRWRSVCESLPWWHERLLNVEFQHRDAFELLSATRDVKGTVIYCDPPYASQTRCDNAKYVHDFAEADHKRLAEALARFRFARVVVSYYRCDMTDALYAGWHRHDMAGRKNMSNVGETPGANAAASECLYINGEVFAE